MGKKSLGRKLRLIKAEKEAKSAPRWVDIKKYGLKRSITRSVKRFRSRNWRRDDLGE
jgi:ribosomal protein L39E